MGRIVDGPDGSPQIPIVVGEGAQARNILLDADSSYDPNGGEPTRPFGTEWPSADGIWAYRGYAINVAGAIDLTTDEVMLKIKHAILRRDKEFERMRREIDAYENVDQARQARRERIPDSVRLFVWQRDEGKCVKCGSVAQLEFDHVIPVIKGGSSSARNIQLLCETCNRQKGSAI